MATALHPGFRMLIVRVMSLTESRATRSPTFSSHSSHHFISITPLPVLFVNGVKMLRKFEHREVGEKLDNVEESSGEDDYPSDENLAW